MTTPRRLSGPHDVDLRVHTWREGLLSPVGHDLQLRVPRVTLDIGEGGAVTARCEAASIELMGAIVDGQVDARAIGRRDGRKIEDNARKQVLQVRRHPEVRFEAPSATALPGGGVQIDGQLTLHGHTRALSLVAAVEGGRLVARARLDQRDFGIKPFSGLLGTLKIRPVVEVRISVPVEAASAIAPAP